MRNGGVLLAVPRAGGSPIAEQDRRVRVERDFAYDEPPTIVGTPPHLPPETPVVGQVEPHLPPIRRGGGRSGSYRPRSFTGRELRSMEVSEPRFIDFCDEPLIAVGASTLIAAYPKTGKTTILRHAVGSWRRADLSVVIFTEEDINHWHRRVKSEGREWDDVAIVPMMNEDPAALLAELKVRPEEIVLVDTGRHAFGIRDENDNAEAARKSAPWIAETRAAGKTLVVAVHENKAGGEHGRGISGAHALFGAFDAAFEIQRVAGAPNRRLVRGWSRFLDPSEFFYERDEDGTIRTLGDASAIKRDEVKLSCLSVLGEEWSTRKELMAAMPQPHPSFEQLRRALSDLVFEGSAERDPAEEKAGVTYRWRSIQPHLQQPLSIGGRSGSQGGDAS